MSKRLNVDDPKVFDTWRKLYYDLSEAEQEQFGIDMEAKYPHQVSFNAKNFSKLFTNGEPVNVLEVGGWKGELAAKMLSEFTCINNWTNIDYCKPATEKTICKDARYKVLYPNRFHWFKDTRFTSYDVFIAAHVIEHLTAEDLVSLIDCMSEIKTVMFEAPITRGGQGWSGYLGTHILEWGWDKVNEQMQKHGYMPQEINQHCYLYKK